MKIGWDARAMFRAQIRGIGTYGASLLAALQALDPGLEVILFHAPGAHPREYARAREKVVGPSVGYRFQLWEQVGLPFGAVCERVKLLHSIANTMPIFVPVPAVVTVHDTMLYRFKRDSDPHFLRHARRIVPALRRARVVFAPTEHARHDIHEDLRVSLDRILVTPYAADPAIRAPDAATVQARLKGAGVHAPYVLALGSSVPRKNTAGAIRAFARAAAEIPDLTLVVTCVDPPLEARIRRLATALRLDDGRIVRLGFVEEETLTALYAGAGAFLYLSLYEGFGLPILEAMRCGAPVICSNRTSCPEVAGDAAHIVDPTDADAVAGAVVSIVGDADASAAWRRRGFEREAKFTWARTAEATLEGYRMAIS